MLEHPLIAYAFLLMPWSVRRKPIPEEPWKLCRFTLNVLAWKWFVEDWRNRLGVATCRGTATPLPQRLSSLNPPTDPRPPAGKPAGLQKPHEREIWLFANPAALASVQKGMQESREGKGEYLGSFAKYLEEGEA